MAAKFQIRTTEENGTVVYYVSGPIDEESRFSEIEQAHERLIVDFRGVLTINSCGVRNWVNCMKKIRGLEISFRQCPPAIVKQLNLVPSFRANAKVLSVYVPYLCFQCDHESRLLVEMEDLAKGKEIPAVRKCELCGQDEMEIDGDESQFKMYG
ncbi:MAG: hypothetical protein H6617_07460 [Bdellovibrionaceae bacterium]|nr:hypothetical protein [Bdellovibrionales bacterium]MCB9254503.1 hypothetical protein [Pseudobdellovibrionaceae bacterium]